MNNLESMLKSKQITFSDFVKTADLAGVPVHEIKRHINVVTGHKSIIDRVMYSASDFKASLGYLIHDDEVMTGIEDGYTLLTLTDRLFGNKVELYIQLTSNSIEVLHDVISRQTDEDVF